jgi:hypothetical protein
MSDAFGVAGRQWLSEQMFAEDERDTVDAALRQIDFLAEEITKSSVRWRPSRSTPQRPGGSWRSLVWG